MLGTGLLENKRAWVDLTRAQRWLGTSQRNINKENYDDFEICIYLFRVITYSYENKKKPILVEEITNMFLLNLTALNWS